MSLSRRIPIAIVFILAAIFHLATIRDGHSWGDDFAQYILHARNIAQGLPYANTGYLINPVDSAQLIGPKSYPPLVPLLFAPLYKIAGVSFYAFKAEQVVFLLFSVFAIYLYFRLRLEFTLAQGAAYIALVAFHPFLWEAKENIGSDILFLGLCFYSLFLLEKLLSAGGRPWLISISLGICLYFAYATRTVGFVLVPVTIAFALFRRSRIRFAIVSAAVALSLVIVQSRFVSDGSLIRYLAVEASLSGTVSHIINYFKDLSSSWANGSSLLAGKGLFLLSLPVVAAGIVLQFRKGLSAVELFLPLYLGVIFIWPAYQGTRFLLPVLPIYLFYLFLGAQRLSGRLAISVAVLLALSIVSGYSRKDFGPDRSGVSQPEFAELSKFINEHTEASSNLLFRKPRALALFAHRSAAIYNSRGGDTDMWALIDKLKISYVVISNLANQEFDTDRAIMKPFVERNRERFDIVYSNKRFSLYHLLSPVKDWKANVRPN